MKENLLVIIDAQNDFIDGVFANKASQMIVPKICEEINSLDSTWDIILTQDTHFSSDYNSTTEGYYLPAHCIWEEKGWEINSNIIDAILNSKNVSYVIIEKNTCCYNDWEIENLDDYKDIYICGTGLENSMFGNILNMISCYPKTHFHVLSKLCSITMKDKHDKMVDLLKTCYVDII